MWTQGIRNSFEVNLQGTNKQQTPPSHPLLWDLQWRWQLDFIRVESLCGYFTLFFQPHGARVLRSIQLIWKVDKCERHFIFITTLLLSSCNSWVHTLVNHSEISHYYCSMFSMIHKNWNSWSTYVHIYIYIYTHGSKSHVTFLDNRWFHADCKSAIIRPYRESCKEM